MEPQAVITTEMYKVKEPVSLFFFTVRLGIIFDQNLSFKPYIKQVSKVVFIHFLFTTKLSLGAFAK